MRRLSVVTAGAIALIAVGSAAAAAIDPSTSVRGSLGVSLEDLAIHSTVGDFTLYLNGGMALLCVVLAGIAVRSRARKRNEARRVAPRPGGPVRATMGETWARLSRPLRG